MMKLINSIFLIMFCFTFFSCKTEYNSPSRAVMSLSKVGDSTKKTGYLIYDLKRGFISFTESKSFAKINMSKRDIINITNSAKIIVLVREDLDKFKDSKYISLSLCHPNDNRLVVDTSNLLYKRFYIVYLEDFEFYTSLKSYPDSKQRLFFCKDGR